MFGRKWQDFVSKLIKDKEEDQVTEEEIISLVEEATEDGVLDADESELIKSAIEFGDLEVIDIFTPRVDIKALPLDATYQEIDEAFAGNAFSRLPIYEEDIDFMCSCGFRNFLSYKRCVFAVICRRCDI